MACVGLLRGIPGHHREEWQEGNYTRERHHAGQSAKDRRGVACNLLFHHIFIFPKHTKVFHLTSFFLRWLLPGLSQILS